MWRAGRGDGFVIRGRGAVMSVVLRQRRGGGLSAPRAPRKYLLKDEEWKGRVSAGRGEVTKAV